MRWRLHLRKLLALLAALSLLPGWGELIETAEHLIHDGHLPHSPAHETAQVAEDHGQSLQDEHGCTPTSHSCPCHVSLPFLAGEGPPDLRPAYAIVDAIFLPDPGTTPLSRGDAPPTPPPDA